MHIIRAVRLRQKTKQFISLHSERIDIRDLVKATGEYQLNTIEGIQLGSLLSERAKLVSVTLDEKASVKVGKTVTLEADVNTNYDFEIGSVVWKSSNESIATVDENGVVTGIAKGIATITASIEGAYNSGSEVDTFYNDSASCEVTVSKISSGGGYYGGSTGSSSSSSAVTVNQNTIVLTIGSGKYLVDGTSNTMDVVPYIDTNNRTMVPARFIAQAMGFTVDYDDATRKVTISNGTDTVILTIDSNQYILNGKAYTMDTKATIIQSRTMVPIRFVTEALGGTVDYNDNQVAISIK